MYVLFQEQNSQKRFSAITGQSTLMQQERALEVNELFCTFSGTGVQETYRGSRRAGRAPAESGERRGHLRGGHGRGRPRGGHVRNIPNIRNIRNNRHVNISCGGEEPEEEEEEAVK